MLTKVIDGSNSKQLKQLLKFQICGDFRFEKKCPVKRALLSTHFFTKVKNPQKGHKILTASILRQKIYISNLQEDFQRNMSIGHSWALLGTRNMSIGHSLIWALFDLGTTI